MDKQIKIRLDDNTLTYVDDIDRLFGGVGRSATIKIMILKYRDRENELIDLLTKIVEREA